MPELPEVETIARALRPELIGRTILEADVRWPRTVATPSVKKFKEQVRGQQVVDISRRAKFLNIQLSKAEETPATGISPAKTYNLVIHLRMSGDLAVRKGTIKLQKHDRLALFLSGNKSLVFNDTRKFGRVWLTRNIEEITGRLGPEPLGSEFTQQWLFHALRERHRQLKPLLLDQTFLAGLGNIYTDEALHMAKLHPLALSDTVTPRKAERLHAAIQAILLDGIRRNGASIDWVYRGGEYQNHFRVYDRKGKPCPVCGTTIKRIVVGQRGTHICPKCQKE
jgi:formamidopyrimidine-DNA glycosylase